MSQYMTKTYRSTQVTFIWLLSLLIMLSAGCSVRLIAEYDENIDKGITVLHEKTETFLTAIETDLIRGSLLKDETEEKNKILKKVLYDEHAEFYRDFLVNLRVLKVRADSYIGNEITVKQLDALEEILKAQEIVHKSGLETPEDIADMRSAFTRGFKGILKLEIAKKRGKESK